MAEKIVRAIKSKAKKKGFGVWVKGSHLVLPSGREFITEMNFDKNPEESETVFNSLILHEIEPDSLCHHFGAVDKDNNEIYTNDILSGHMANGAGYSKKPKFQECQFIYRFYREDFHEGVAVHLYQHTRPDNPATYRYYPHIKECKVIGNVHDNEEKK